MMCEHCPVKKFNKECIADPVLCRKVDKDSPKFKPEYIKLVLEKSGIETDLPSLAQRIENFSEALTEHFKSGFAKATQNEQRRRMTICEGCELNEAGKCKSCGCYLDVKTTWKTSKCPLEKWGEEIIEDKSALADNPVYSKGCDCNK